MKPRRELTAAEMRTKRRILALAAALLVPIAVVAVATWLVHPVAFANRHIDRIEQIALRVLGQQLTVGGVEGRVYPDLDVTVRNVVLSSAYAGEEPMLVLPSIHVRFKLRRALLTLGNELPIESVHIEGAVLRARRDMDGRVDVLDVLKKLPLLDPKDLEGGVLSKLTISHAQLRLADELVGDEVIIEDINVETHGPVALGMALHATATSAWGDAGAERAGTSRAGAPARAFALAELRLERVPEDLVVWPPPPASVRLELPRTELVSALAWLGLPELFAAGVVDVHIDAVTGPDEIRALLDVRGSGVSAVVTTGAGAGAETTGAHGAATLRTEVRVAVDGFRTQLDGFDFRGAGIGIEGAGVFLEPTLEGVESLDVSVQADELARLGLLIPPLRDTSEGALRLSGAGTASIHATPRDLAVELDFDGARVQLGEALSKRGGERLRVSLKGTRDSLASSPSSVGRVEADVSAQLPHGVRIGGALVFQPYGIDRALFDMKAARTSLANAAALSPVVRDMVDGSVQGGSLAVGMRGHMSSVGDNDFRFALSGRDLKIDVDGNNTLTVAGAALVNVTALTTDARGLVLHLTGDLDDLAIESFDASRKRVFEKAAGSGLAVRASLAEAGGPGSLGRALDHLDPASQQGGAVFVGHGLSPRWRRFALGMNGHGSLQAEHAVVHGLAIDDTDLRVSLRRGQLTLEPARVHLLSGRASVANTVVDLRSVPPKWTVALEVEDIELARVLEPIALLTGAVEGRVSLSANLHGAGLSLESLLSSLDGPVVIRLHEARIAAIDSLSNMISNVWNFVASLPFVSKEDVEQVRGPPLTELLRDGEWTARFRANQFRLDQPVVTVTSAGVVTLQGHASLDGSIELSARLDMIVPGTKETVPVEALVTGTWMKPELTLTNFDRLRDGADAVFTSIKRAVFEALGIAP